jgi:peptidoglycan hydrolase-like protein with peptidoglycan-binding domain
VSRRVAAVGAVALLAVGGGAIVLVGQGDGAEAAGAPTTTTARSTEPVVRRDLEQREEVDGRLGYGSTLALTGWGGGTITALPSVGEVVERGQQLWEVDGQRGPTLLYGSRPMYRDLSEGVDDGPDVRQLEENLVALGYADAASMTVDDHFTSATGAAVERWQEAVGLEETGTVTRSRVVFTLGPVRVAEVKAALGRPSEGEVLSVTGTTQQVHVDLATDLAELAQAGATVDVELPDGSTVQGTITSVGTVVERSQSENGGETATLPVTISLPAGITGLDDAPVDVELVRSRAEDALAVPVRALLALAEGGYAVEAVQADGTTRLVGVELGEFADGYVAIQGEIAEGDPVVVP